MSSSLKEYINHLNVVYNNSLNEDTPLVDIPPVFNIPLHAHQKGIIARMQSIEEELMTGTSVNNSEHVFSNYAILGDSVGVGKSLMVLGHIARMNMISPLVNYNTIHRFSSSNFFSIRKKKYTDLSEAGCLLVVPHTLFRQWSDYIQKQSRLSNFCVARLNQVTSDSFKEDVFAAEVVLISNTLLKPFLHSCHQEDIKWKRLFIDEADTIHMPGVVLREAIKTRFTWFITASWINLLYLNNNLYFDKTVIQELVDSSHTESHLKAHFNSRGRTNAYYYIETSRVKSFYSLRDIISGMHPARSHVIVKCSEEYIKNSISLPLLIRQTILCRIPVSHSILQSIVSPTIQQMLHAGDTEGALSELGVKGQTTKELIEAVTENLKKELVRLQKTYDFKESLEYSSASVKEASLATLKDKIKTTTQSIESIQTRIEGFKNSTCPICFEEPENYIITPCCQQGFCAPCLLLSISAKPLCPLCRAPIAPSKCKKLLIKDLSSNVIVDNPPEEIEHLPKKNDALLKIIRENPTGKFLIFSRYDNSFDTLESSLEGMGIHIKHLKGNKDAIRSTLHKFECGRIQCLLLNSQFAGTGLNITAATHVILLHAMTHDEEKQILGRAYRVGREGPLIFIKLLHANEENYSE
jgi:SNF2 family DNA or RNA helicase